MSSRRFYNIILFIFLVAILAACGNKKKLNSRITLWRNDKNPYGTWYAYNHLSHLFPGAEIETINKRVGTGYDSAFQNTLLVYISYRVDPDRHDLETMLEHARNGGHILVSTYSLGQELQDSLGISSDAKYETDSFSVNKTKQFREGVGKDLKDDSLLKLFLIQYNTGDTVRYTYPGYGMNRYLTLKDTAKSRILGLNEKGNANFIRIDYPSGGSIYIHTEPLAFSNFFLLHNQNKTYYDQVMDWMPQEINMVIWNDYFRSKRNNFSAWQVILGNVSLRWALYVVLLLFALLIFSEAKRRQRIIPEEPGLDNSSLDFVKTVGRLYFQQGDNHDLAQKMIHQFKDYVRTRYNMPISELDEKFIARLSGRSGYPKPELEQLVYSIKMATDFYPLDDETLLSFNQQFEKFYKYRS